MDCDHCHQPRTDGPDPCLGLLAGVESACCGHGGRTLGPYVSLDGFNAIRSNVESNYLVDARATGLWMDSMTALNWFAERGVGPLVVPCEPYDGPCPTDPVEATAYLNTKLVEQWSGETWNDEDARLEAIARHS